MTTQWRFALGVCMLSAALLVGSAGGAIAAADPESGGSTGVSQGADEGSTQGVSSATEPVAEAQPRRAHPIRSLIRAMRNRPAGVRGAAQPTEPYCWAAASCLPAPQGPMTMGVVMDTEEGVAKDAEEGVAAVTTDDIGYIPAVSSEDTSHPDVVVSQAQVVAPPPAVVASDPTVVAPATKWLAAVRTVVAPVRNAVKGVGTAVGAIPVVVAKLPSSPTPVKDVITAVRDMVTSVAGVGSALARAPSDLASLLGFPGMAPGTIAAMAPGGIGGSLYGAGLSAAVDTKVLSFGAVQWPQILVTSGNSGVASVGNVAGRPTLEGVAITGLSQELSVSGAAPVDPESVAPTGVLSILEHTISAVLVPASLTVLAALALPGIGGLLLIGATGMMVGYRQAKAASTLRAVGIARFVRAGPLGVVRSGSLVVLHPRASRADRRQPSWAASHLEPVA